MTPTGSAHLTESSERGRALSGHIHISLKVITANHNPATTLVKDNLQYSPYDDLIMYHKDKMLEDK